MHRAQYSSTLLKNTIKVIRGKLTTTQALHAIVPNKLAQKLHS